MADTGKMKFLRRFPEDKHDQIVQVMNYLQMCGLSGKDIVSIGGWMDRSVRSNLWRANKERIQQYIKDGVIVPIGRDRTDDMRNRFKYKSANGDYNFDLDYASRWTVTSMRTKARMTVIPHSYEWPAHIHWHQREFYDIIMSIADGRFSLNF